ncbi:hypothetical protein KQX54_006792 [Cotesia glomerata]|uniref:Uncharacterized protein n=1 Tax=Cotesia glomerata TaxID=32391 RepID=A0AAV7I5S8_COTGL|nr:hypothetical protein KQX54_006792 [Cotesia glomerata]
MSEKCKECTCVKCTINANRFSDVHLHAEIEQLRQKLKEKENYIVKIETQYLKEVDKFPNGKLASMKIDLRLSEEKHARLIEAQKRMLKVNQNLEDKLLKLVDKCETEKSAFIKDIATLSHRLADANLTIHSLSQDNARYRADMNLAIQSLQCKPSNFVGQKYDSLPIEVQSRVKHYMSQKRRSSDQSQSDVKSITVPISTFPPTAMVYNITKTNPDKHSDDESDDGKPQIDVVSAAIMAKVLEDRERERILAKHCSTSDETKCQTLNANKTGVCTKINQDSPSKMKIERQSLKIKQNNKPKRIEIPVENIVIPKSQGQVNPVDIINERIWKNNWTKSKLNSPQLEATTVLTNSNSKSDIHLDVINERIWKTEPRNNNNINNHNNNINSHNNHSNQVTVIEVLNEDSANQTPDFAASPSFSNDSVLMSSSEPSSSSSDLVQINNEKRRLLNPVGKGDRVIGPRNCLMRVSREGSKNILLDNAGQYQTVLYTSSGSGSGSANQTNTALVHNLAKSTRSGRSLSTSSEEALPILSNDATQLQRVAEWVQSSVGVTKIPHTRNGNSNNNSINNNVILNNNNNINNNNNTGIKPSTSSNSTQPQSIKSTKSSCIIEIPNIDENNESVSVKKGIANELVVKTHVIDKKNVSGNKKNLEHIVNEQVMKDLICFDSTNEDDGDEDERRGGVKSRKSSNEKKIIESDLDCEVKITKEMEETYLKLAASLDPRTLRLPTSVNADLTIEKYRKDHKKINMQKNSDKSEAST